MSEIFDFDAAIAQARADYPEETKNVTFIDLCASDAVEQYSRWAIPDFDKVRSFLEGCNMDVSVHVNVNDAGFALQSHATGKIVLAIRSKPLPEDIIPGWSEGKYARYVFGHELGHIVTGALNGKEQRSLIVTNREENRADCFAILKGLKDQTLSIEGAEQISHWRLARALRGDFAHLTSYALDRLLKDVSKMDFSALTPGEIKNLAIQYASEGAPREEELHLLQKELQWTRIEPRPLSRMESVTDSIVRGLINVFLCVAGKPRITPQSPNYNRDTIRVPLAPEQWLQNVADICMKQDIGRFTPYMAAKILASPPLQKVATDQITLWS